MASVASGGDTGPVDDPLPREPSTGLVLDRARTGCGSNPATGTGGSGSPSEDERMAGQPGSRAV
ncbi:hypothetical protein ACIOKD_26590 [Streptomyces sp. NPDC087844]|uniref:hypothetical protein n=1 Tax=Streptomyces sp. NPDC087844 TaxID=3365805 RepID=UPI0037FE4F11